MPVRKYISFHITVIRIFLAPLLKSNSVCDESINIVIKHIVQNAVIFFLPFLKIKPIYIMYEGSTITLYSHRGIH